MSNVIEGKSYPTLSWGGKVYKLPEPTGPDRSSLRQYDFNEIQKSTYFSEGKNLITVGRKWQFVANLSWYSTNKVTLKMLQLAACQEYVEFVLNSEIPSIKFNVKVISPKFRFMAGLRHSYSVSVQMVGSELLDAPGYGDLEIAGYGLDYGNTQIGQTP